MALTRELLIAAVVAAVCLAPGTGAAADPLRLLARRLRPKPPAIDRSRIDQDFAVLLMRSSYSCAEDMRFVAMDEFQRSFFLNRQEEWQPYLAATTNGLLPRQGELTDPAYFDFISFAQYSTLADEMRDGKLAFVERVGADGDLVPRKRPPDVPSENRLLPAEHRRRVGDAILSWAAERYDVAPAREPAQIEARARELLEVFRVRGFVASTALQLVQNSDGSATLTCSVGAPATLWSQRVLERSALRNDFEAMAVCAYLRACGAEVVKERAAIAQDDVRHTFMLRLAAGPAAAAAGAGAKAEAPGSQSVAWWLS